MTYTDSTKKFAFADSLCRIIAKSFRSTPQVEPVQSQKDLIEACQLLYRQYRKRNYCRENEAGLHSSPFMLAPQARTFVGRRRDKIFGTISLFPDSDKGLPADDICKEKIDQLREANAKIAEVGLLATELEVAGKKKFSLNSLEKMLPLFSLYRALFRYVISIGITDLIISIHPKHKELYTFLGFRQLCAETRYEGACGTRAISMHMNIEMAKRNACLGLKMFFLRPSRTPVNFENYPTIHSLVQTAESPHGGWWSNDYIADNVQQY